jgi:hypothetical protein
MQKTTAPNSSGGAFVDESGSAGTTIQAADLNAHQNEICNAITYNGGANGWVGQALSGADLTQLFETIVKVAIEHSFPIGGLFYELDYAAPAVFNPSNPHAYRPFLCIDSPAFATPYQTITTTHWPLLVPYLIAFRSTVYDGQAGSTAQYTVTNGIVTSNQVTLTFDTSNASKAILAALSEDAIVNNNAPAGFTGGTPSWTNWQTITLPSAITIGADTINAGTYMIIPDTANYSSSLGVDPANRRVTFSYTASNVVSTGISGVVEFHPFAIAGSSTSAQIMAMQGRALISPNDVDPSTGFPRYVPGQRTRDRFLGHYHSWISAAPAISAGTGLGSGSSFQYPGATIGGPSADTTNATTLAGRTGPTTDVRALTAHLYIHGGQTL